MPPRKRAEAAPKSEPEATPDEGTTADGETTEPAAEPPEVTAPAAKKPAKSDIQTVPQPCPDCFPNGWPTLAYAVGCEHGSWVRDDID